MQEEWPHFQYSETCYSLDFIFLYIFLQFTYYLSVCLFVCLFKWKKFTWRREFPSIASSYLSQNSSLANQQRFFLKPSLCTPFTLTSRSLLFRFSFPEFFSLFHIVPASTQAKQTCNKF